MRPIVLLAAVVAAAFASVAPAATTHDLRGVWSVDVFIGNDSFNNTQEWQIDTIDLSTGHFTGSDKGNTRWSIDGTATGDSVTLSTPYKNSSYSADMTGTITSDDAMNGTWSDTNGQSGRWTAKRTSSSAPPPPPVLGSTVNAGVEKGTVLVRKKGSGKFVKLTGDKQIPVGSEIDASSGTVQITAAAPGGSATQTAEYHGGRFVFTQTKGTQPVTEARLSAKLSCGRARRARAAATRKRRRKLWTHVTGAFRTRGHDAITTARGTRWLVTDTCEGTRVKVTEGVVDVRDIAKKKTVPVPAGKTYFARRKG